MSSKLYDERLAKDSSEINFNILYKAAWGERDSVDLAVLRYTSIASLIKRRYPRKVYPSYKFLELGCGPATFYHVCVNFFSKSDQCVGIEPYSNFANFAKRYFPVINKTLENISEYERLVLANFSPMFAIAVGLYNKWQLLSNCQSEARAIVSEQIKYTLKISPVFYIVGYGSGADKINEDSLSMLDFLSSYNFKEYPLKNRKFESVFEVTLC